MSYRPITDVWILARPKVKFYGAYPAGFLSRARALLGVRPYDAVLHVCAGAVRQYPGPHNGVAYKGLGPNDMTLDASPDYLPDFLRDANLELPPLHVRRTETPPTRVRLTSSDEPGDLHAMIEGGVYLERGDYGETKNLTAIPNAYWPSVLIDRPYTKADHLHYEASSRVSLPSANLLLRNALRRVALGCRVGILDYVWPRPPLTGAVIGQEVAVVAVLMGRGNQARVFTVFEKQQGD